MMERYVMDEILVFGSSGAKLSSSSVENGHLEDEEEEEYEFFI